MEYPKLSIVTPTYNQGAYIEKTIDSVLSQNYPNLEFIIIDGGSQDNTVEIIKKYERHLAYWVSEPDRGQSHAINKGFSRATGDLLTWLNSDDWYTPGALDIFARTYQAHPNCGLIVGAGRIVDEEGREKCYSQPRQDITINSLFRWTDGEWFLQPSSVFSKRAWEKCGPLNENEHIALDLELWIRIAQAAFEIVTLPNLLSEALSHSKAKTTAYEKLMFIEIAMLIARYGGAETFKPIAVQWLKDLEDDHRRLAWYDRNYMALINNPLIKLLRPIVKRLSRDTSSYWNASVPPWVKQD